MKLTYRPEIDGLRFLAVISVILYHLNLSDNKSIFDSGYLGVDIFFVISGFLISKIIFSELLETKKFNFKLFYEKRARRILPVLIIVVLFSLIPSLFLLLPNSLIDFSKSIFFSLIFNSNLYFHFTGLIYGAEAGLLKPFLHTWTLSVEEQFYIFAPILIVIIFKFLRQKIFLITFLFFFISLILSYYGSLKHPSFNFYFVATRAWEIIFGSMLALIDIKYKSQITLSKSKYFLDYSMPKLGFLLIILSFIIFDKNTNHPSFITLLPVIGTGLIIFFSNRNELITKILSYKIFTNIGLISYSLYLWHYPIFAFGRHFDTTGNPSYEKIIWVLITFLLSIWSYKYVEQPFRKRKSFKEVLNFFFTSVVLILIFVSFVLMFNGFPKRFHHFLDLSNYKNKTEQFELNYNYDNFQDNTKNVFIVGNSYADDLLRALFFNKSLKLSHYFYTASPKVKTSTFNYQIECFLDFLVSSKTKCHGEEFSNHLFKQYKKAQTIILLQDLTNEKYLNSIIEIKKLVEADKKNLIVILNDLNGSFFNNMNDLDRYLKKHGKLPKDTDLVKLEKKMYKDSEKFNLYEIRKAKKLLKKHKIKFFMRRSIFCNNTQKKCPIITNSKEKVFRDWGHFTLEGTRFLSDSMNLPLD